MAKPTVALIHTWAEDYRLDQPGETGMTWGEYLVMVASDSERFPSLWYKAAAVLTDLVKDTPDPF